jgi:stage II sporulation protein D
MRRVLKLVVALLLGVLGVALAPVPPAEAAGGYTLTAACGTCITTSDTAIRLTVRYRHDGASVRRATARLQYLDGTSWVTERKVAVRSGKGTARVRHAVMDRTYRFIVAGRATSDPFTVHFVPAGFRITGSGLGHGVGMAQWGAYGLARQGATAADILGYYYSGATLSTAVNNPRTVKVQLLGPPADVRTTTSLKVSTGGFTVTGDGAVLKSYPTRGTVAIGVRGSLVTAKVTLANGKVRNQVLRASSRLTLTWAAGPVGVTGAHGSYKAGNLQVTVIAGRPNVVNEVAMNTDYLYGVDEMPSAWGTSVGGAQALRAQAVAARNYIITVAGRLNSEPGRVRADCDCQVFDDTRSQNYTGWRKAGGTANRPWVEAVDATVSSSGSVQVLRDAAGDIVETPYFASSGSFTADGTTYSGTAANADAFGTAPLAHLAQVEDPFSATASGNPHLSWSRTLSQARAQQVFGVAEPVLSVEVVSRYPGGLARTLRATTLSGRELLISRTSEGWRTALALPGAWVAGIAAK